MRLAMWHARDDRRCAVRHQEHSSRQLGPGWGPHVLNLSMQHAMGLFETAEGFCLALMAWFGTAGCDVLGLVSNLF